MVSPTKGAPTSATSNPIKTLSVRREPTLRLAPRTPHTRGSPGGRVSPHQPSESRPEGESSGLAGTSYTEMWSLRPVPAPRGLFAS